MGEPSIDNKIKVTLFKGIGKTLTTGFLVFALIPITLIGVISYLEAHKSLEWEIQKGLVSATESKTREITTYFDNMLSQLRSQSTMEKNAELLSQLIVAYEGSRKTLSEFIKSYQWAIIVDQLSEDIKWYAREFVYYDVFLITNNGNLIFTVSGERNLGTNILSEDSKFAAAFKRTMLTGKLSFSDYERYEPSGNHVFGFIIAPVIDLEGVRIGAMAFQFLIDPITRIMRSGIKLGDTANVYLVGPGMTLRSKLLTDDSRQLIDEKIVTFQTAKLQRQLDDGIAIEDMQEEVSLYTGPLGDSVLGIHRDFMVENINFSVIAEINEAEAFKNVFTLRMTILLLGVIIGVVAIGFTVIIVRRLIKPIIQLSTQVKQVEQGNYSEIAHISANNEIGDLATSFNTMVEALSVNEKENALKEWFMTGQMELNNVIRGKQDLTEICRDIITFLAKYLNSHIGAFYLTNKNGRLKLTGTYAFSIRKHLANEFDFGEGLVGQAALEKERIQLMKVPADYITVQSGLGESVPQHIVVTPIVSDNSVLGVLELGSLAALDDKALEFLDLVSDHISVSLQTVLAQIRVQELLEQSQTQTEELETQQEELRLANQSLEKQTNALKSSESVLQEQQEELRQTNEGLEEQTQLLTEQKNAITDKNRELEETRNEIEKKARDLDIASRYKSEFLANMSHELRTPLNSILLLSKHLSDNKEKNLSPKQIECASTVHTSGNELLSLINEVLDLAKVESGKMILESDDIDIKEIADSMERNFRPVSENKGISFDITIAKDVPKSICTDYQRVSQILKNLLSNAFKFTEKGGIKLDICLKDSAAPIIFMVKDTGSGIAEDKLETVFHAFKQADGSTSRKYGGTGLGLSISRELAHILGGTLEVTSTFGEGSIFTLSLPKVIDIKDETEKVVGNAGNVPASFSESLSKPSPLKLSESFPGKTTKPQKYVEDDRKTISKESRSVLIIEDDPVFAKILRDSAREKGFKTLVAESGEAGLQLTDLFSPNGIILDMGLPGMNGKTVLFRLKDNLATRHIPVHIISGSDKTAEPLHMGAVGYLTKPVTMEAMNDVFGRIEKALSKRVKKVLVVEDNKEMQIQITALIGDDTVKVIAVSSGEAAKKCLLTEDIDCIILDLGLPDMSGKDFLSDLRKNNVSDIPVIIHTAKELDPSETALLDKFSGTIVIKDGKSEEKLIDDICLFLHRVEEDLPEDKKEMIRKLHDRETVLKNKKILIVDDDMRNVFSLISILEVNDMNTIAAKNGLEALEKLKEFSDIDLVLMDIMMPEMDGYEATKEIRKMNTKISKIPIIALTAKAMKGDRSKCIEAGASDYLSKPVDADKLFSMLRVWLY